MVDLLIVAGAVWIAVWITIYLGSLRR